MNPNQPQPQNNDSDQVGRRWAPGQNPFLTEPLSGEGSSQSLPSPQPQVSQSSMPLQPQGGYPGPTQSMQPQSVSGGGVNPGGSSSSSNQGFNKMLIIIVGVVALLVIVIGLVVVVASGGNGNQQEQEQEASVDSSQPPSLQPATALDIQQVTNAITHDMSTVDDDIDYPNDSLDSKPLGL